jgi:hypothetical protein
MSNNTKPDDTQPIPRIAATQGRLEGQIKALWAAVVMVGLLALVSLAVNVLLVARLLVIRNALTGVIANASRSLDNLAGQGISFDFPISQTINFEGDVPIKQDLNFPFKSNFPIDTTVSVPVDLGPLGQQVINVPVKTTVPVDVNVPIHVDQTIHVKTEVPIRITVPIRLGPNDPPLKDLLAQVRAMLENLRRML